MLGLLYTERSDIVKGLRTPQDRQESRSKHPTFPSWHKSLKLPAFVDNAFILIRPFIPSRPAIPVAMHAHVLGCHRPYHQRGRPETQALTEENTAPIRAARNAQKAVQRVDMVPDRMESRATTSAQTALRQYRLAGHITGLNGVVIGLVAA